MWIEKYFDVVHTYLLLILNFFFFKIWLPEEQFLSMDCCILNSGKECSLNPICWCSQRNNKHLHFIGTNQKFFCLLSFLFMVTLLPNIQQCACISILKHFPHRTAFLFQSSYCVISPSLGRAQKWTRQNRSPALLELIFRETRLFKQHKCIWKSEFVKLMWWIRVKCE